MSRPFTSSTNTVNKRHSVLLLYVAVLIFLWSNGFGLRIFVFSERFKVLQLIGVFTIPVVCALTPFFTNWKGILKTTYFPMILWILLVAIVPTFVNLVIVNGLNPVEVLRASIMYTGFFVFVILYSFRADSQFVFRLSRLLLFISTVYVSCLSVLAQFPAFADVVIENSSRRFDLIRIAPSDGMGPVILFSLFYTLAMFTKLDLRIGKRIRYGGLLFLFLWYYFTVSLLRRTILVIIIVMGFYWLFKLRFVGKVVSAVVIIITVGIMATTLYKTEESSLGKMRYGIYSSYTSAVEELEHEEGTVQNRLDGMRYYMNLFPSTLYLGTGMFSNRLPENNPLTIGRSRYGYNSSDHGIVAVFYRFGFAGLVLTFILLIRMFKDLSFITRRGSLKQNTIAIGIQLYLFASAIGLLQIFWKGDLTFWTGLMFFMVMRMRHDILLDIQKRYRRSEVYEK